MRITVLSSLLLCLGLLPALTDAQNLKIPQPSTTQRIEQDFGLGSISVAYSRPNNQ